MRSVADELRIEDQRAVAAMTAAERVELAIRLGNESLAVYMATHGVDRKTALHRIRARSQHGRRRCRCLESAPA